MPTITPHGTGTPLTRRTFLAGLVATFAAPAAAAVPAGPRANSATRRFWMTSIHTREHLDTIYFRDGQYVPAALQSINRFMRDWRTGTVSEIDIRAINIWSALHDELGSEYPFALISGYRSPKTNNQLRSASGGVARKSLHMKGMAADLRLRDRSLTQIARAAKRVNAGGVGIYVKSNFIHVDSGRARQWVG